MKDKTTITNIFTELIKIQQREYQIVNKEKKAKGWKAKYKADPSDRLAYFLKEHSNKILTFEQLLIKDFFQDYD